MRKNVCGKLSCTLLSVSSASSGNQAAVGRWKRLGGNSDHLIGKLRDLWWWCGVNEKVIFQMWIDNKNIN